MLRHVLEIIATNRDKIYRGVISIHSLLSCAEEKSILENEWVIKNTISQQFQLLMLLHITFIITLYSCGFFLRMSTNSQKIACKYQS